MPVRGPYYSKREIERMWVDEGGRPAAADVASAIALAESAGGAGSFSQNPAPGFTNWGLFQLARRAAGNLLVAQENVRAAIKQSDNGRNWCDWSTWDGRGCRGSGYDGSYRRHLDGKPPPGSDPSHGGGETGNAHSGAPLPEPASDAERQWDYSPSVRAAGRARSGHANVVEVAARNVLTKLGRWRLPR